MKNEKKIGIILSIVTVLICILAVSFAIFTFAGMGERSNIVTTGTLVLELDESLTDGITLLNAFPISDQEGLTLTPYVFSVRNTGSTTATYELRLIDDEQAFIDNNSLNRRLAHSNIKYSFTIDGGSATTSLLSSNNGLIDTRSIAPGETVNYTLRVWLDLAATNEVMGQRFHGMLQLEAAGQGNTNFNTGG